MGYKWLRTCVVILLVLLTSGLWTRPGLAQTDQERCFPAETGHCIQGRFLEYWDQNGGLAVFGYPIASAENRMNRDTGQIYLTQWFERARFELHSEHATPYDVLLGRLGDDLLLVQHNLDWHTLPHDEGPQPGCLWFAQTGRNVCDQGQSQGFKTYWETHGLLDPRLDSYGRSLALFGLPLTAPRMETNHSGHTVLTQWFERARFEWHPDNLDQFKVLLGLLGNESHTGVTPLPTITSSYPQNLTNVNGTLFFSADDGVHGRELWRSDGTTEGTVLVRDIYAGPEFSTPSLLTNVNGTLFFTADDGQHGEELWRSDGTWEGTVLVKDIHPGSPGSNPFQLTVSNGTLFFIADDGVHGAELWKSDGTTAGTILVKDINPGVESSWPYQGMGYTPYLLTDVNGRLFFFADDGVHGIELWTSDGTTEGTRLVRDLSPGGAGTFFAELISVDGLLFFSAYTAQEGYGLWRSDGSSEGTILLQGFDQRSLPGFPGRMNPPLSFMTSVNNILFFTAWDEQYGYELWRSDGTPQGTFWLRDINPGPGGSLPFLVQTRDGMLFFTADDGRGIRGLWHSDGTPEGTLLVEAADIFMGSVPRDITPINDGFFFLKAPSSLNGNNYELWRSDGTMAGTVPIRTFYSPLTYLGPELAVMHTTLFLSIADATHGIELWRSDGTPEGTILVKDIYPIPNEMLLHR